MPMTKEQLKAARRFFGFTQRSWAQHIGVSYQTVQRWEQGTNKPKPAYEDVYHRLLSEEGVLSDNIPKPHQWTAQQITGLRRKLGLTQAEFASRLAVSRGMYNRWERGKASPSWRKNKELTSIYIKYKKSA